MRHKIYNQSKCSDISFACIYSHSSVDACLAPLCSVDHMAVTTVEGIGSTRTKIHPVQV